MSTASADHQRFMVLGSARTGSNLLMSLLSSHPAIKTYGELFKLDMLSELSLRETLNDPVSYLQRRIVTTQGPEIRAAGFKIFYYHLTDPYLRVPTNAFHRLHHMRDRFNRVADLVAMHYDWEVLRRRFDDLWKYLVEDQQLVVIHLKRRNMLSTLISLKSALMTDRWWSVTAKRADDTTTVCLDPEECLDCFEQLEAFAQSADVLFGSHRTIEVFYEDLVADREAVAAKLQERLNVPCRPLATRLTKQIVAAPTQAIENYPELKEFFRDTRWSGFFE